MDLFEHSRREQFEREAPLAYRMRPHSLDEFVGQEHIIGPGKLLRRAIEADRLSSIILWGPPGCGKTTLASVIANHTASHFETLSAVLAGVKDLRAVIAAARERRNLHGIRTVLFIDEIHRWNKAQQDALLPYVEDGLIILIGATTENPYFEVIGPLISRSRIFELKPLSPDDIRTILQRALSDREHGFGMRRIIVTDEALEHLVRMADGDARNALNALELAVLTTPPEPDGTIRIDLGVAQESIQRRAVRYDKGADEHYDTVSAFIKSVRGSDPDAALFWLAKMITAGEDPRFILRRLLILAGEDIGLADPQAIVVASACAQAFEWVGLPEGLYHLAEATLYLATAPKSNSVGAIFRAMDEIQRGATTTVPPHLRTSPRNRNADHPSYVYPHDFPDHYVPQRYLPEELSGRRWYRPSDQGYERQIAAWLAHLRGKGEESEGGE
ncbi:MAG TPA: AAA family ATPase [Chloroflexi bacterium]|nr:AAA family ATPase [Chloroflexota bacterium]